MKEKLKSDFEENLELKKKKELLLLFEFQLLREKLSFCRDCFKLYSQYVREENPALHNEADGKPSLLEMSHNDLAPFEG